MSNTSKIVYTLTDEAPRLATASLLPIIQTFAAPAGIEFVESDISVAGRILAEFPEYLSEKQRMVFVLREIEEKESREIAEILGCRESTVRNHLFQARRLLRDEVRKRFPEFVPRGVRA